MFGTMSDHDFNKKFLISFAGHVALVFIAWFGGETMLKVFKNNDVEIIRSSVRVDVVGMPKFTAQELMELQKTAPPQVQEPVEAKGAPEVKKVDVEDVIKKDDLVIEELDTKKKKKASFLNLVADYSSQKVAPKPLAKGSEKGISNKNFDSLVVEGNRLSKGSALIGDFSDDPMSEFAGYVQTIPELVKPNWKLPSYLMDQDLRCRIRIHLGTSGEILKLQVLESSGVHEFDVRAEKAVRTAAPFPKPSEAVGVRLASSGIILGFPL